MELNRNLHGFFQRLDKIVGAVRGEKSRHILDADGIRAGVFQRFGVLGVIVQCKDRTGRVGNTSLHMTAVFLGGIDGSFQIADIVERVEDTHDVNAVVDGFLHEVFDDVVGIMAVAQHILTAEEHLELGVGTCLSNRAKAFPRVFPQKTQAGVKRRAAPAFERMEAHLVQIGKHGNHVLGGHAGGNQRLMRVAQNGFGNFNLWHNGVPPARISPTRQGRRRIQPSDPW